MGATLALLAYGALAVFSGLDRLSLAAPGMAALVPTGLQAQAARSDAALLLSRERPNQALVSARRAVAADPLDPAASALLGGAQLMLGREHQAEQAFRVAARFGWRDAMTQAYWFEAAMQAGDLPRAVDRADALLRAHPNQAVAERVLPPLEATAAGRRALVRRMADRPQWIDGYLEVPADATPALIARRNATLLALAQRGTRLGCERVAGFVAQAAARGPRAAAEQVWVAHCPGARPVAGLADGEFDRFDREAAAAFGWKAVASGDVGLRMVEGGAGRRSLAARNSAAVSRMVLRQSLALPPGAYRLTVRSAPGRFAGSIGCDAEPPLPSRSNGDPAAGGQVLQIGQCHRLELALWLRPGVDEVPLDTVALNPL